MTKPKVLVTREIPEEGLEIINEKCTAEVWHGELPLSRKELLKKVSGIDGLLCMLSETIDEELMNTAGPQLKVVSNYAVGYDNINIPAATARGIVVCNTPGVLTETTADLAFSLLMSAARRVVESADHVRAGKWKTWEPKLLLGMDIHQATLGIIGLGRIGRAVARRGRGFNMKVLYYDQDVKYEKAEEVGALACETMDELLKVSDFVSLHVPLSDETLHLIDENRLEKMKSTAILINTSRGQVVDTDALYKALKTGEIAYAALDVTDPEPLPAKHKLLKLPNCLVVPHIGSATVATRELMSIMAAESLMLVLKDEAPRFIVNPEVLQ